MLIWRRYCRKCHLEVDTWGDWDISEVPENGRTMFYHGKCWRLLVATLENREEEHVGVVTQGETLRSASTP